MVNVRDGRFPSSIQYHNIIQGRSPISQNFPKSQIFFDISMTNYFVGVTNDVIFNIEFPKLTLSNLYSIAFCGVINSTYFGDFTSFESFVKHLIKLII